MWGGNSRAPDPRAPDVVALQGRAAVRAAPLRSPRARAPFDMSATTVAPWRTTASRWSRPSWSPREHPHERVGGVVRRRTAPVRRREHRHRPAAVAGHRPGGRHYTRVDVLPPSRSTLIVRSARSDAPPLRPKGLVRHDVAQCTRGTRPIPYGPFARVWLGERVRPPCHPSTGFRVLLGTGSPSANFSPVHPSHRWARDGRSLFKGLTHGYPASGLLAGLGLGRLVDGPGGSSSGCLGSGPSATQAEFICYQPVSATTSSR